MNGEVGARRVLRHHAPLPQSIGSGVCHSLKVELVACGTWERRWRTGRPRGRATCGLRAEVVDALEALARGDRVCVESSRSSGHHPARRARHHAGPGRAAPRPPAPGPPCPPAADRIRVLLQERQVAAERAALPTLSIAQPASKRPAKATATANASSPSRSSNRTPMEIVRSRATENHIWTKHASAGLTRAGRDDR